jgi:hypothetical protein
MGPLGSLFERSPEDKAADRRDRAVERAAEETKRADATICTLR